MTTAQLLAVVIVRPFFVGKDEKSKKSQKTFYITKEYINTLWAFNRV
jgi:hypothetical protein